jgi:hypothetical protein
MPLNFKNVAPLRIGSQRRTGTEEQSKFRQLFRRVIAEILQ